MANQRFKLVNFKKVFLLTLFLLGLFLRFYKLGEIPKGLSWDEASIGYNAWLVSETGRDEWGEFLPIHFRAFGEWKLPGYIYFTIPWIKLFGLNHFSVRFLSALAGICFALAFAWLWRAWMNREIAVVAFFLAWFSFWSVFFSRVALEANLALCFFVLGLAFFFWEKYFWAAISFLLTIYTYNSFRVLTPLFFFFLVFWQKKRLGRRKISKLVFIFVLGLLPLVRFLLKEPTALSRFNQVRITASSAPIVIKNYLTHFSPSFLLLNGDPNGRHFTGFGGQFSALEAIFFFLGVYLLFFRKAPIRLIPGLEKFLLFWLFLAPLPAALTKESPHALRGILLLPAVLNFVVLGVELFRQKIKLNSAFWQRLFFGLFLALSLQYIFFYRDYFLVYPKRATVFWQEEYQPLFEKISQLKGGKKIFISSQRIQPYIFYLFYTKTNIFQTNFEVASPDFWFKSRVAKIDNLFFVDEDGLVGRLFQRTPGYYAITSLEDFLVPSEADIIFDGGSEGFLIFEL